MGTPHLLACLFMFAVCLTAMELATQTFNLRQGEGILAWARQACMCACGPQPWHACTACRVARKPHYAGPATGAPPPR